MLTGEFYVLGRMAANGSVWQYQPR